MFAIDDVKVISTELATKDIWKENTINKSIETYFLFILFINVF